MTFAAAIEVFVKHYAASSGETLCLPGGAFKLPDFQILEDGEVRWNIQEWYAVKYGHIHRQESIRRLQDIVRALCSESFMLSELRCCGHSLREAFRPAMPSTTRRTWLSDVMRLGFFASKTLEERLLDRLCERPDYESELLERIPDAVVQRARYQLLRDVVSGLLTEGQESEHLTEGSEDER